MDNSDRKLIDDLEEGKSHIAVMQEFGEMVQVSVGIYQGFRRTKDGMWFIGVKSKSRKKVQMVPMCMVQEIKEL